MAKPTVFLPLLFVALLVACGDDRSPPAETSAPTATAPATSPSVTPSSTATPAPALPGDIARAIDAAKASDGAQLGTLLTSTQGPCVANPPPGLLYQPACPAGISPGTAVPALVFGGCPDEFRYLNPSLTFRVTEFDGRMFGNHLVGVVGLAQEPLRYAALFGFEKIGWLGFDAQGKLIGAGGGGDCPMAGLRPRLATNDWLVGPDWGE